MTLALTPEAVPGLMREARAQVSAMTRTPLAEILGVLDRLGRCWEPGGANWRRAREIGRDRVPFSLPMLEHSLSLVPQLLCARSLRARLAADLDDLAILDRFVVSREVAARSRAFPLGVLLHVSAGNVFLGAIDSLLMGFITKNVSIVKLSSRNLALPAFLAETLREVDTRGVLADKFHLVHFDGGDGAIETPLKQGVDGIIAWGGDTTIQSYRQGLPTGVRLVENGPRISLQVVCREALAARGVDAVGRAIAHDLALWDQAACASPQNLFVEQGVDAEALMAAIASGLDALHWPRGRLSDDEHVELLKERARGGFDALMHGAAEQGGADFYLRTDPRPGLRPSPLNRTLLLKRFASFDDLVSQVRPFARELQSCGVLVEAVRRTALLDALGGCGVMRFSVLGRMLEAPSGSPHDGRKPLLDLVRLVPDERDDSALAVANDAVANVPFYRRLAGGRLVASLEELPCLLGRDLSPVDAISLDEFVRSDAGPGLVFASGGTSGNPKVAFYAETEIEAIARLLAEGFAAQGLRPGDVVANLFTPGSLWSAFLLVDRALARLGARVLPMGGAADLDATLDLFVRFPPRVIAGLPTRLVELGRRARERELAAQIPVVLYAGEHLSLVAREGLRRAFGTRQFGSAGYASVDAGPIGYQCAQGEPGVHHLFSEQVHLEIIDGEAVVTSLIRRAMPVLRLRTGDRVEPVAGACGCGVAGSRFRLLGRADSQFNLWGCRLFLEDVDRTLADLGQEGALFQVVLRHDAEGGEHLQLQLESAGSASIDADGFASGFHRLSQDLRASRSADWVRSRLSVHPMMAGGIARQPRTGKIRPLVDER